MPMPREFVVKEFAITHALGLGLDTEQARQVMVRVVYKSVLELVSSQEKGTEPGRRENGTRRDETRRNGG